MPPLISIFVPFTRWWMAEDFLSMFDKIIFPRYKCELIFYNDTDSVELQEILSAYIASCGFASATLHQSNNKAPGELYTSDRRKRIVDMKNRSVGLVGESKYTFCLEDDTFVEPNAFMRLYHLIDSDKNIGVASGVQKGRWGFPIVGAWQMDDIKDPQKIWTLPVSKGLQRVHGLGWYCYITRTYLYKSADYRFEAECLGPDVCYTWDLCNMGYNAIVDWDLIAKHRINQNYLVPDDSVVSYTWFKRDGKWQVQEK